MYRQRDQTQKRTPIQTDSVPSAIFLVELEEWNKLEQHVADARRGRPGEALREIR